MSTENPLENDNERGEEIVEGVPLIEKENLQDVSNQSLSHEAPDDQAEVSEGSIEELVRDMEKIEQEIERGLPPEKAKAVRSRWKGFVTALLMATSSAGAVESNKAFSQEGANRKQAIEAVEGKEKVLESKQLDVALLYLHTTDFNMNRYQVLPNSKENKGDERKYTDPLARAYREVCGKNVTDKDNKYRVVVAQLQTAELTVMQELGKEIRDRIYDRGPADVNASETPDRVSDIIYDKLFGEKNENPNRRLILVASYECKPPVDDSGKRLGQWGKIPAIDVILVSRPDLKDRNKNEELWKKFCGKNGSLTIIAPKAKEGEFAETIEMRTETARKLYESLSEKLTPRDQQKGPKKNKKDE